MLWDVWLFAKIFCKGLAKFRLFHLQNLQRLINFFVLRLVKVWYY